MKSYDNYLTLIAPRLFLAASIFVGMILPLFAGAEISQNLRKGNRNPSVRELQKILNSDPETRIATSGPGSPGDETDYFGSLTFAAVKRFQQKYSAEVLAPTGLTAPTGFVGSYTRSILNILATFPTSTPAASPPPSQLKPTITDVTPQIITQSPMALTITGTNFTPTGNTVFVSSEPRYAYANLPSRDNKIELNFRASGVEDLKTLLLAQIPPAEYNAVVKEAAESIVERLPGTSRVPAIMQVINTNGESAPFTLLIDAEAILLAK